MTVALMAGVLAGALERAAAQQVSTRYRVLVPSLAPLGGANADFGKKVSEAVRREIDALATHAPFDGNELRDALRGYHVKEDQLAQDGCAKARQLAGLIEIPLVMCGSYEVRSGGMEVTASFISPSTGDVFRIDPFVAAAPEEAAQRIVREFERYVQALSSTLYCQQDVQGEQWTSALERCNTALAANPMSRTALYLKATALWRLDSLEVALATFRRVIELDPTHEDAYKAAGIIATTLDLREEAGRYFTEFLRLNPGDAAVRIAIAHDVAQAGDPEAALALVEEGVAADSADLALRQYAGQLALAAAVGRAGEACDSCGMPAEARVLFEKSYDYLRAVFEAEGAQSDSAMVGNMAVVLARLDRNADVLRLAERVAADGIFTDANFWIAHAEALEETGDLAGALASLDRAAHKDPAARIFGRKAAWLIEAGRVRDAVEPGREAVRRGEVDTNTLARMIAVTAFNEKAKAEQHADAIAMYEVAAGFAHDAESTAMVSFFHGYSLMKQAIVAQEASTAESARRALPMFQRARAMIAAGEAYPGSASSRASLLKDIDTFIEIQDALIRRGR
jgi:tetratricopeptide (TPR) repeat protein